MYRYLVPGTAVCLVQSSEYQALRPYLVQVVLPLKFLLDSSLGYLEEGFLRSEYEYSYDSYSYILAHQVLVHRRAQLYYYASASMSSTMMLPVNMLINISPKKTSER